jgi:hypothetical protein
MDPSAQGIHFNYIGFAGEMNSFGLVVIHHNGNVIMLVRAVFFIIEKNFTIPSREFEGYIYTR